MKKTSHKSAIYHQSENVPKENKKSPKTLSKTGHETLKILVTGAQHNQKKLKGAKETNV